MTDLLQKIRAKCIEANPDSDWYWDVSVGKRPLRRNPRLADVLLAMRKSDQSWYVRYDGVFFKWEKFTEGGDGHHGVESTYVKWNLCEDDLEKQSPETIEFLAKALGV